MSDNPLSHVEICNLDSRSTLSWTQMMSKGAKQKVPEPLRRHIQHNSNNRNYSVAIDFEHPDTSSQLRA